MISRQSKQIEKKNLEIEKLKQLLEEKDEIINAVEPMRRELAENIEKHKQLKNEYEELIQELRQMKETMNQTVYKGRWKFIKFFIK